MNNPSGNDDLEAIRHAALAQGDHPLSHRAINLELDALPPLDTIATTGETWQATIEFKQSHADPPTIGPAMRKAFDDHYAQTMPAAFERAKHKLAELIETELASLGGAGIAVDPIEPHPTPLAPTRTHLRLPDPIPQTTPQKPHKQANPRPQTEPISHPLAPTGADLGPLGPERGVFPISGATRSGEATSPDHISLAESTGPAEVPLHPFEPGTKWENATSFRNSSTAGLVKRLGMLEPAGESVESPNVLETLRRFMAEPRPAFTSWVEMSRSALELLRPAIKPGRAGGPRPAGLELCDIPITLDDSIPEGFAKFVRSDGSESLVQFVEAECQPRPRLDSAGGHGV